MIKKKKFKINLFLSIIPIVLLFLFIGIYMDGQDSIGRLQGNVEYLQTIARFLEDENWDLTERIWELEKTIEENQTVEVILDTGTTVFNVTVTDCDGEGFVIPWEFRESGEMELGEFVRESAEAIATIASESVNNIENLDEMAGSFEEFYDEYFNHFEYTTDIDEMFGGDYVQTPEEFTRNNFHGDCDDSATYLATVAKAYGLNVRIAVGVGFGGHAWLQIIDNGTPYEFDSTNNEICEGCIYPFYATRRYAEVE